MQVAVLLAGVVAFLGAVPKPAKALLMRLVAALGFGVDASRWSAVEAALLRHRDRLAERVAERTAELTQLRPFVYQMHRDTRLHEIVGDSVIIRQREADGSEVIRQSTVLPRRHDRGATAQNGEGHPALGHAQRTQTPAGKAADGVGVGGVGVRALWLLCALWSLWLVWLPGGWCVAVVAGVDDVCVVGVDGCSWV